MANTRLIKRRIRSAQNIAKITKAMEMVSASKMRRAQQQVQASRPYANKLHNVLSTIASHTDPSLHPLLQQSSGRPCLVILSTDRGLCGGLNTNLFKAALEFTAEHANTAIVAVGRKAQEFAGRAGLNIVASFTQLPEKVSFNDTLPIAELVRNGFLSHEFASVHLLHMEFVNTLTQKPTQTPLLPLARQEFQETTATPESESEYVFEPSPKEILDSLLPYYVEMELYQLMLDAKASEHSARMIAMQNASNNARDVVASLQLEFNKSRQAGITKELLEITTASLTLA